MQTHRYSFFGQKTAMILQSGDWADPWLFLTFIKKRDNNTWEKLAEGKCVKLSLPEIVALKDVVGNAKPEWKTFHKNAKNAKQDGGGTVISARVEADKDQRGTPTVVITAGSYVRPVSYPETVILGSLLAHVFEEKIARATGNTTGKPVPEASAPNNVSAPDEAPAPEESSGARAGNVSGHREPALVPSEQDTGEIVPEDADLELGASDQVPEAGPDPEGLEPDLDLAPDDEGLSLADTLARLHIPPLPQRLPSGVFPVTGRLKEIRMDKGVTTLFIKTASGRIEEYLTTDIVGAGVHGAEVDLVVRMTFTPPGTAARKGKPRKPIVSAPIAPPRMEATPAPADGGPIRAAGVKRVTEKAVLVLSARGAELWIPKAAIADATPAPASPQDAEWRFAVKDWFAAKADFQAWVKSA